MSGLGRVVRAGVARRRVAALVTGVATLAASAAAVAATALLIASQEPFAHAFAQQHGAELTLTFDATKVSAGALEATAHADGVTAAAGPFPLTTVTLHVEGGTNMTLPDITLAGRGRATAAVDDVALTSGRWPTGPSEIVLSTDVVGVPLGTTVQLPEAAGAPTLTVVGYAQSVTKTADAWTQPGRVAALADRGTAPTYQMLYRFERAGTAAELAADRTAVTRDLPGGALVGYDTYLAARFAAEHQTAPWVPFVVAFGALALATAVLIITSVVSGAVGAARHRIGVLKALGSTPSQVVRAFSLVALVPAAAGVVAGTLLGNVVAGPILHDAQVAYGTGELAVSSWTDLAVPAAVLALVAVSAVVPALRAGRLPAVAALTVGRTPRPGRGRVARRVLAGTPLPQPVSMGLGMPSTRPGRFLSLTAALVFGTTALTFAVGLVDSLRGVQEGLHRPDRSDVTVVQPAARKGGADMTAADAALVESAIAGQHGTADYVGLTEHQVHAVGAARAVTARLYVHARTSLYQLVSGHWYTGRGQALVPTGFLTATGTRVGDSVTLVSATGQRETVRIVGEILDDLSDGGMEVVADAATFPGAEPSQFAVTLAHGTDRGAYLRSLGARLDGHASAFGNRQSSDNQQLVAVSALAGTLTLLVLLTAGLGVLNTVAVELRERVREVGVAKAVGMTPGQTTTMVLTAVGVVGLVAAVVGVGLGIALHHQVVPLMGHAAGTNLPAVDVAVFGRGEVVLLGLAGVAVALLAALVPATWAARLRTATALRTE